MSLHNELADLLSKYLSCINEQNEQLKCLRSKTPYNSLRRNSELLKAVETLELLPVFNELAMVTMKVFSDKSHADKLTSGWQMSVKHFFRRSGIYFNYFVKGRAEDFERLLSLYEQVFTDRIIYVTHLAPLEGVIFTKLREGATCFREKPLNFGTFQIRRFTPEELTDLLANEINEIFYPYATWDINKLCQYYFLVTQSFEDVFDVGTIIVDFSDLGSMRRKPVPKELSSLCPELYQVVLFDWRPETLQDDILNIFPLIGFRIHDLGIKFSVEQLEELCNKLGLDFEPWFGLRIPVVGKVVPNLKDSPTSAPDATRLIDYPYCNHLGEEMEGPVEWFTLNEEETIEFENFLREKVNLIKEALLEAWPFFQISLEYLTKAFLTDPYSSAPEQLLWHITSIEALLGEKGKGITNRLAQRLGRVIGKSMDEQQKIEEGFKKLYLIRCNLVHGNQWREYSTFHLYEARNFARHTCLWFLNVANICREKNIKLPSRDEILSGIDSGCIF